MKYSEDFIARKFREAFRKGFVKLLYGSLLQIKDFLLTIY